MNTNSDVFIHVPPTLILSANRFSLMRRSIPIVNMQYSALAQTVRLSQPAGLDGSGNHAVAGAGVLCLRTDRI